MSTRASYRPRPGPEGVVRGSPPATRVDRRAWTGLSALTKGLAILVAGVVLMQTPPSRAQDGPTFALATGEPGSASYRFGLGVASLLESVALPDGTKVEVEVQESLSPEERVSRLREDAGFAVVAAGDEALADPGVQEEIRAVVGLADGNQLLVSAGLADDLAYQTTQVIFENAEFLRLLDDEIGDLEPAASFESMTVAVHPGALRYYREHGLERSDLAGVEAPPEEVPADAAPVEEVADAPAATAVADPEESSGQTSADPGSAPDLAAREEGSAEAGAEPRNFTVYFGFDESVLDPNQIPTVAEACRYAATLASAEFILNGHADTVGPEPYNDGLSLSRAQSVAAAIRNDPRFQDATSVMSFGERDLAVPTANEVKEPKNRRVVITVVAGER